MSVLRFLLGHIPIELDLDHHLFLNPSSTLLSYLRSLNDHKGVKEGCAEGDCGACTVVVAFPDEDGHLKYMAVNSCLIFLPWLHGKQLITVEHLSEGSKLHPVQQAMVDLYGSQCGFCTPGIIMSLFALYKNNTPPLREAALQFMSGNLCRCTGYQPILEAALLAMKADGQDHFSRLEREVLEKLKNLSAESLSFNNRVQQYFKPATLGEALGIRLAYPDALLCNGATDVALLQSKKHQFLPQILDLSGIGELKKYHEDVSGWVLGSGLSIETLWNKMKDVPVFDQLFSVFASHQIRNLATLGGNIGSASPIGDSLPVLIALEASVILVSKSGKREIPIEQFITGYRKTLLKSDEIIHSVRVPKLPENSETRFFKVSKRKELDISTVSLAARLECNPEKKILKCILAFGGVAERPVRATEAESWLEGKNWDRSTAETAASLVFTAFSPISDARSCKEVRNITARNLILKFFLETSGNHES
jgi:xanthine dehydrogenase small subunit